jgi:ribosomal protein L30E
LKEGQSDANVNSSVLEFLKRGKTIVGAKESKRIPKHIQNACNVLNADLLFKSTNERVNQ